MAVPRKGTDYAVYTRAAARGPGDVYYGKCLHCGFMTRLNNVKGNAENNVKVHVNRVHRR